MSFNAPAIFNDFARDYDRSRHRLVPDFDRFYGTVAQILAFGFAPEVEFRVLDLGAGTGLLSGLLSASFPNARFTLVDAAPRMLEEARGRFAGDKRFEFQELDLEHDELPGNFNCAVSSLAIHHLAPDELKPLFRRISEALKPGGVFVNADQTLGVTTQLAEQFEAQWRVDARAMGSDEAEIAAAIERRRADRHAPLEFQLEALRGAGFESVECIYKRFLFAVYAGWKPAF